MITRAVNRNVRLRGAGQDWWLALLVCALHRSHPLAAVALSKFPIIAALVCRLVMSHPVCELCGSVWSLVAQFAVL